MTAVQTARLRIALIVCLAILGSYLVASRQSWLGMALIWAALLLQLGWQGEARTTNDTLIQSPLLSGGGLGQLSIDQGATGAQIIDALADPALILDRQGRVVRENAAAVALLGPMAPQDPIELYLRQPAALEALRESLRTGATVERHVVMLSPAERFYEVRSAPLGEPSGETLLSLRDQTSMRLTERTRMDFVANASHELRTPLATLIGFIETLQGPAAEDNDARIRFLEIMSGEADRMARLIEDLLSLSRIEMDKYIRPTQQVALEPLLGEVVEALAMRLAADNRPIETSIEEGLPPVIADRDQILQVAHNLLFNALKYGRSGTPITLVAEHDRKTRAVRIAISDQGEGISPEHLPRLTERFYRVDTARSRSLGGTGLGLAIVKHIVERHRGRLQISSQLGVGTTVEVLLPTGGIEIPPMPSGLSGAMS